MQSLDAMQTRSVSWVSQTKENALVTPVMKLEQQELIRLQSLETYCSPPDARVSIHSPPPPGNSGKFLAPKNWKFLRMEISLRS